MRRDKKNTSGESGNIEITQKALEIRTEMISIFEDLRHNPENHELLARFHKKCEEFNSLLKNVNRKYEKIQADTGVFNIKN